MDNWIEGWIENGDVSEWYKRMGGAMDRGFGRQLDREMGGVMEGGMGERSDEDV